MSTNAAIAIKEKGGYSVIYNHWDGYPEYVGTLLHAHYRSEVKVRRLIDLGNISSLRERVEPRKGDIHTFDKPLDDVTVAYARDRGEEKQIFRTTDLSNIPFGEFLYVYIPGKREWKTYAKQGYDNEGKSKWKLLTLDYDKQIKDWILKGYFSILPRGYDSKTGERK